MCKALQFSPPLALERYLVTDCLITILTNSLTWSCTCHSYVRESVLNIMLHRIWPTILFIGIPIVALAASTPLRPRVSAAEQRALQISRLTRASQFVDVPHISSRPDCSDGQPPEALTTPDPLFPPAANSRKVKVSFIIGTDGRVHSPLILESAGLSGDRRVLQTVRTWRYRPATCNGVPTEIEGKIEFSSR